MRELSLFSGAGGGLLGTKLLGWETIGYVEFNDYCQRVIAQRIKDGILDDAPIFGDIRTFISEGYAASYTGLVDVITGGFPCQDISCAGSGKGIEGERSGLWNSMSEVVRQIKPRYVFVENSPMLTIRGLGTVLRDLAKMGYDAKWGVFSAKSIGAPIERERLFIACTNEVYGKKGMGIKQNRQGEIFKTINRKCPEFWLQAPPVNLGMVNGMADYMESVGAIGNGQVPGVVKTAWELLNI